MAESFEELITEARQRHQSTTWGDGDNWCMGCGSGWPCDASRLADAVVALSSQLREARAEAWERGWHDSGVDAQKPCRCKELNPYRGVKENKQ